MERGSATTGIPDEHMYRALIESISHVVYTLDDRGHFTYLSPRCEEILGVPPEALVGRLITSVVIPPDKDRLCTKYRKVKQGCSYPEDYQVIDKDGGIHTVRSVARSFTRDDGKTGVVGVISEIVNWQTTDEIRRESEEKYRMLVEGINHVIFTTDTNGNFTYVSPLIESMTGFTPDEMLGKDIFSIVTGDEREKLLSRFTDVLKGISSPADYKVVHKNGNTVVVRAIARSIVKAGTVTGMTGLMGDISGWRRTEEVLAETEEKVRKIVEFSKDGIFLTDETGTLLEWSPAMEQITGVPRSDAVGRPVRDVQSDLLPAEKKDSRLREGISGQSPDIARDGKPAGSGQGTESEIERPDKVRKTIESIEFPVPGEKGTMVAAIVRDITERKKTGDALKRANRQLSLMTGITRHDITNQLSLVESYLCLLGEKELDPPQKKYLDGIAAATQRISSMIRFTREYESIGASAPDWQDCRAMADAASNEARPGAVKVKNNLPSGAELFGDPLIVKVFYTLIDNAVRHGGKTTTVRFSLEDRDGNQTIVCEDDGIGIPAAEKENIFGKGFGKNTGLGLFLAREILSITGMTIRETGETGKGARFEIFLPDGCYRKHPREG